MFYLIVRYNADGQQLGYETRKRGDAALLVFNNMVDTMVRDHASLDTVHGAEAQLKARRATYPRAYGKSADVADRTVYHQREAVTLRLMPA